MTGSEAPGLRPFQDAPPLERIFESMRARCGIDFRNYRRATILRRVQTRMIAAGVEGIDRYAAKLEDDPEEAAKLLERLSIKVSRFFRNADGFAAVGKALARKCAGARRRDLSVWSAGCGRGEEPYSLAALLDELGYAAGRVLATDIDPKALEFALAGRYPEEALAEVDAERRARYFSAVAGRLCTEYAVAPMLSRRVEFRRHDVTSDRLPSDGDFDLVCCRNVLIYFEPALQHRVLRFLGSALAPGGLLFLGEAEWLAPTTANLEVIDRKSRLFRRARKEAGAYG
jgi:chemotaxis methyl-accepting protein methylase